MNSTIRNLIIAAPLATAAITMVPAAAMAAEPGPVNIIAPHSEPQPDLDIVAAPEPVDPDAPDDKAPAPKPESEVPDDKAPLPQPTHPDGPDDITNPEPCPTHGVDCTPGDDEPTDGDDDSTDEVVDTVELPNRIDAGLASEQQEGSLDIAWLFAGGLAVTASGAAFAVRRRTRGNA
jgi:hypothetical protein